ncbi:MAG TPA: acyltransferase family protein [Acidimicrobiales bacterium]|jgi:peptidoglycan/LPS O-acetylase OafA/YrhL|nr:acyltransferase family protein [Acidimicrobiales bacterium]
MRFGSKLRRGPAKVDKHEWRPDIQGLRAVAVLLVALCHARVPGLEGGYVGVDVFFVISGFLITGWLLRRREGDGHVPIRQFYAARARRILPAAALTVVATVVATYALLTSVQTTAVIHDSFWAAIFAANVHFAQAGTNYFSMSSPPSPLQHYWSLAVEEQFYLVWPALAALVLLRRRPDDDGAERRPPARGRLGLVLAAGVAASLTWSIVYTAHAPAASYFSTFTRAWELGVGSLLAVAAEHLGRIPARLRQVLGWLGLAGIVVAAVRFNAGTPFPGVAALLPVGSAALVVIGGLGVATGRTGAESGWGAGRLLSVRPARFMGDVSYSFYLWHWPVLVIASEYAGHDLPVLDNCALLVGAFGLSVATYRYFEMPLRYGGRLATPWAGLSLWPATISAVMIAGVVVGGSLEAPLGGAVNAAGPDSASYVAAVQAAASPAELAATVASSAFAQIEAFNAADEDQCVSQVGSQTSSRICHLGDSHSSHVAVVFGDSHAQMWLDDLDHFGSQYGWQIVPLIKQGCTGVEWSSDPNAVGPADVVGTGRGPVCNAWYRWAIGQAKALRPTVIIAATAYSWGSVVGGLSEHYDAEGVLDMVRTLHSISHRVVLVQDAPYVQDNPVSCLLAHGATVRSCSLTPSDALHRLYDQVQTGAERAGARVMPVLQWFCTNSICPSVVNGNIVYRDTQHMSPQYEAYLEQPFCTALKAIIGPP